VGFVGHCDSDIRGADVIPLTDIALSFIPTVRVVSASVELVRLSLRPNILHIFF
jgi:hypothetical protein